MVSSRQACVLLESALDQRAIKQETRDLLHQGMVLSGASDLWWYLLAAGERMAHQLISQARRQEREQYASIPTSALSVIKVSEASQERCRRALYTIMQWNEAHRLQERWYITTLSIQKLVGGSKNAIKAYLEAHQGEIEAHHWKWQIKPSFNRKSVAIQEMMTVPEEPTAFPWSREPM